MPKNQQPITNNQQPKFYLLHGDDDIAIEEAVKQLRAGMGEGPNAEMNISDYQGEEVSVPKVLNDVRSFPFLADHSGVPTHGTDRGLRQRTLQFLGAQASNACRVEVEPLQMYEPEKMDQACIGDACCVQIESLRPG